VTYPQTPVVAVVGGGVAGLAAAFFLRACGAAVTVLEGSPRLGGKLAVSPVAGIPVDEGAEALLARRPEGTGLIREIGLAGQLVRPGTLAAWIWSRGRMRPLPRRQFFGVPADLGELAECGLLSPGGLARARRDLELPATARDGDVPVARHVAARFGPEVVERLVDPLLAGVYAGRTEELSFEATLPALAAESAKHASLAEAVAALLPGSGQGQDLGHPHVPGEPQDPGQPQDPGKPQNRGQPQDPGQPRDVFTTLAGGLGTLPAALAAASGATVRTGAMVRELARAPEGWRLTVGSAHALQRLAADAVVLAVPAAPAGRLLAGVPGAAPAAAALAGIGYASMAIVTLAYPLAAFPCPPQVSGYLVPAVDGRPVKAVTFSSVKWPHLARRGGGLVIVRCSLGRAGEEALLQAGDGELAALAASDLAAATGVRGSPVDQRVTRWGGALPQYRVGHTARVASIRAAVAGQPGLAVCGAAYDGIGIPACIASARSAAARIATYLTARGGRRNGGGDAGQWNHGSD
jgi:oxygen-dependent protoporphyrinogen oxidase